MNVTVYRQPVLTREEAAKGKRKPPPNRSKHRLLTLDLPAELLPKKRVQVRFSFGDWLEFRDNGEPCLGSMSDYVLAPESVAEIAKERAKEKAERKAAKAAGR